MVVLRGKNSPSFLSNDLVDEIVLAVQVALRECTWRPYPVTVGNNTIDTLIIPNNYYLGPKFTIMGVSGPSLLIDSMIISIPCSWFKVALLMLSRIKSRVVKLCLQSLGWDHPLLGDVHVLLILSWSSSAGNDVDEVCQFHRHSVDIMLSVFICLGGVLSLTCVVEDSVSPLGFDVVPSPFPQRLSLQHIREDDRKSHGRDVVAKRLRRRRLDSRNVGDLGQKGA